MKTQWTDRIAGNRLRFFLAALLGAASFGEAARAQPLPQLIYFKKNGLELEHNPVDRLIARFGTLCDPALKKIQRWPCRIEVKLVNYLKSLPESTDDIAERLSTLGAACRSHRERLTCTYHRRVETEVWKANETKPTNVDVVNYYITFLVNGERDTLNYGVSFDPRHVK